MLCHGRLLLLLDEMLAKISLHLVDRRPADPHAPSGFFRIPNQATAVLGFSEAMLPFKVLTTTISPVSRSC